MEKSKQIDKTKTGIFVRGLCVSSSADAWEKKDKSGLNIMVRHELALQPGMAVFQRYYNPDDPEIRVEGSKVTMFPKLDILKTYEIHASAFRTNESRQLVVTNGTIESLDES